MDSKNLSRGEIEPDEWKGWMAAEYASVSNLIRKPEDVLIEQEDPLGNHWDRRHCQKVRCRAECALRLGIGRGRIARHKNC